VRAEQQSGGPLTEAQVLAIRDQADFVMTSTSQANAQDEERGYRDVDPENAWADWHRLRVQLTGAGSLPKIVLCLPGDEEFKRRAIAMFESESLEFEFRDRDEHLVEAFKASATAVGLSLRNEDYLRIDQHSSVLYISSPNFTAQDAPIASHVFLHVGQWLLEEGAEAIKCESSGIVHSESRWNRLAADSGSAPADKADFWIALFRAYVQFPVASSDDFYTCGMHLLGSPDAIISKSVLQAAQRGGKSDTDSAGFLLYMFCLYVLIECGDTGFIAGHTFQPDETWPRLRLAWEPCQGSAEDDILFNPFGRWRFVTQV
jgi:hypothetical protein